MQWVVLGVHVGEWVMLLMAAMYNVLAIAEHGRYGLSCLYAETGAHEQCWVCMVCMVYCLYDVLELKLCCEILLLLNMVDMDQWKTVEIAVQSTLSFIVCEYRLCPCREFCSVHIVGNLNGTRCRDGVKCCGVIPI